MKRIFYMIAAVAAMLLAVVSCSKKEEYKPGEKDLDGCYGVYFDAQQQEYVLDPSEMTSIQVTFGRAQSKDAITVPITITDTTGIFSVSELKFADGQDSSSVIISFDKAEIGVAYKIQLSIEDNQYASLYSSNPTRMTFTISRDKWNDLGKCSFTHGSVALFGVDLVLSSDDPKAATLYQNDRNKNLFRIDNPYPRIDDESFENMQDYLMFRLLEPGDILHEDNDKLKTEITEEGLVYNSPLNIGFLNDGYIYMYHPSEISSFAKDQSKWLKSRVLDYQENGLPTAIQLAPIFLDDEGGWDYSSEDDVVTIVFPGAVLVDYTLCIEQAAYQAGSVPVEFKLGTDVDSVKYATYEGELNVAQIEAKAEAIVSGQEKNVVSFFNNPDEITSPYFYQFITPEKTGKYTTVAVAFDTAGVAQNVSSLTFSFVTEDEQEEKQVILSVNLLNTSEYAEEGYGSDEALKFNIFGEGITDAKLFLATSAQYANAKEYVLERTRYSESLSAEEIEMINTTGLSDAYLGLTPGTDYVLVVWVTNGYVENNFTSSRRTTGSFSVEPEDMYGDYDAVTLAYDSDKKTYVAEESSFTIAKSDSVKYQLMFTKFCGYTCAKDSAIYATMAKDKCGDYLISVNANQVFKHVVSAEDDIDYSLATGVEADTNMVFTVTAAGEFSHPFGYVGAYYADKSHYGEIDLTGFTAVGYDDVYAYIKKPESSSIDFSKSVDWSKGVRGYSREGLKMIPQASAVHCTVTSCDAPAATKSSKGSRKLQDAPVRFAR